MKRPAKQKGPSRSFRHMFNTWILQHVQACLFSLGQITKNPVGSLLTTAVIGVSLSLPAGFYMLLDNAHRMTAGWAGAVQITLFLDMEVEAGSVSVLSRKLSTREDIRDVKVITREQAFLEYKHNSGFGEALAVLDENPLPYVLLIRPAARLISTAQIDELMEFLGSLDEVESAQFDRQWATKLLTIIEIFQRGTYVLSFLLAFAVLLVVGNTIRLAIYNRRAEIEINKLFGATDAFIRRPFLYSGMIHGIGGSIMAWFILFISSGLLEAPVRRLAELYGSSFQLISMGLQQTLILVVAGGVLGLAGSWIAVYRHIRAIGLS